MKTVNLKLAALGIGLAALAASPAPSFAQGDQAKGDPEKGRKAFIQRLSCHSARPDVHKTGPSLATIAGERAANVTGFHRYSPALKASNIVWTNENLEKWMVNPEQVVPGTTMKIPGVEKAADRKNIIAYLHKVRADQLAGQPPQEPMQQERGMMQDRPKPDLKTLGPERQVKNLRYCGDTYEVTTAAGETHNIWEFNLRFKSDSSNLGPAKGEPVIIPASMMGDRAFLIFADPAEISSFVEKSC